MILILYLFISVIRGQCGVDFQRKHMEIALKLVL